MNVGESPVDSRAVSVVLPGPVGRVTRRAVDYAMPALPGGVHQGLPSPWLTLVVSLAGPVMVEMADPSGRVHHTSHTSLIGGLSTRSVQLPTVGEQRGIQLDVSPMAARQLLGAPSVEFAHRTADLGDILGGDGRRMIENLRSEPSSMQRFRMLSAMLNRNLLGQRLSGMKAELARAWILIVRAHGNVRIGDIAAEIGWSRRHLLQQCLSEFGVGPKDLARIARFDYAMELIRRRQSGGLSDIAATAGYVDQAHFSSEFRRMVGCTPTEWLQAEFPFLQDLPVPSMAS